MTVLIASIEDASLDLRMDGVLPDYNQSTHEFQLNRPIGDDWLQYIRHVPEPAPLFVRTHGSTAFVVFDTRLDAEQFADWLREARLEQRHGFSTMRE